ncbi:MAG: GNAT family N-acetyltransferase [Acidimicrobiia bacterium]
MTIAIVDRSVGVRAEEALVADVSAFVDGLHRQDPGGGARRIEVAGGVAAYTGAGMFAARVQGAGLAGPVAEAVLDAAEAFYAACGLAMEVELCPLAHETLLVGLAARGHVLIGFRNVYVAEPATATHTDQHPGAVRPGSDIEVVRVGGTDVDRWSSVLLDGFGYRDAHDRLRVARWNRMVAGLGQATAFLALRDGRPVGAAHVLVHGRAASLGGTATLPAFRRQGVQAALLRARLDHAARQGCDLAVVTADPGSGSARNVERAGFRLAHTNARLRQPGG